MAHWSTAYLGIPHESLDCAELVQLVLQEQFGRRIQFPKRESDDLFHRSALITKNAGDFATPIDQPVEGCGVLFLARGRMAHIGLYCVIDSVGYVLHSDSSFGSSMLMPLHRMPAQRYRVEGFYAWLD